jgi:predicted CoA-binding protein
MTDDEIASILAGTRTIAVVGLSDDPSRPSHRVAGYLRRAGYRIVPVNPRITRAHGERAVASLRDVGEPVDVVLIFRRPEHVPAIVEDAITVGAKTVWMQNGITHPAAAARARGAGLAVVQSACMMVEHRMRRRRPR